MVLISSNTPNTYTYSVSTSNRSITVSGAIDTAQYISDVTLIISNVVNPSPAGTTSPFLATIGIDYSAYDPFAALSLTPAIFTQCYLTFSPSIVNTTANLIVSLMLTNSIPAGGSILVSFPTSLSWIEDIAASTRKLVLSGSLVCNSLNGYINSGIVCSGVSNIVTVSNITNILIPTGTIIKFSINNLFSPPT